MLPSDCRLRVRGVTTPALPDPVVWLTILATRTRHTASPTRAPGKASLAAVLAVARTFALAGVEAVPIDAEVDIHRGLPSFAIVGLPDAAVRESRERVRAAIVNSGCDFPLQRITVSLAPSDLRKAGPGFDLAIAAAILAASDQLSGDLLSRWAFAGELGLDGGVRPVRGALAMAEAARRTGARGIVVAEQNAAEAALVGGLDVAAIASIAELTPLGSGEWEGHAPSQSLNGAGAFESAPDIKDLRGQPVLRRALEVAAAGSHSVLVVGPPGAGKSMAARRLPSLLPPLTHDEALAVRRVSGVAGIAQPDGVIAIRPYRAPHHTISAAGLVGGGTPPRPGEVTLAHGGVLFLDELPEFNRGAIEALRQPLESSAVTIARAAGAFTFPADFQLIAAANPCPCGYGTSDARCKCSPDQVGRYACRLSGALADRIDISINVGQPDAGAMAADEAEPSTAVRERVVAAREVQHSRYGAGVVNATVDDDLLRELARAERAALDALDEAQRAWGLSGRGWTRALRLARTCADLEGEDGVGEEHVAVALSLRGRVKR